jgi:hypothetical protein
VSKLGDGTACTDACQCASGVCSAYYTDGDGDSYGAGAVVARACGTLARPGQARNDNDCDDAEKSVYPRAPEVIGDGIDQDCDKEELCYQENDGDGYRSRTATIASQNFACTDAAMAAAGVPDEVCDSDKNSNPLQTKYQTFETACKTFDWNSDDVETRQHQVAYSCALTCTSGWESSRSPACGVEAIWRTCGSQSSCSFTTVPRTQSCR